MAYQSKYTGLQIDDILDSVEWKQGKIEDLASIRAGAQKGATALQSYTEKYTGTVTGIKINGVVKSGSGVIDLGTISTDISGKVDKVAGKQLSTEDFTTALKTKLEGLSNYDDTELSNAIATLRGDFDNIVSGDTTTAIKTFNEVIAFLDGLTDTQDLESIIANIEQQIAGKADNDSVVHTAGAETITGVKTFNGRVNFLGSGDSNAMYLSTNTRLNVDGTTNTVLGFSSGTFLINNAAYNLTLRGKGTRPTYNSTTLALSSDIPAAVTENTVSGWGFTKNAGTYSKPSGGIPKTDLASAVQTSLGKADTALQSYTEQYKGTITGVSANGTSVATSGVANIPAASTSKYGVTKLNSSTSSTSTTEAATPSAVKAAYDLANSYKGTVTGVKINGTTKNPSNGVVDLGTVITSHQDISGKQDKLVSGTNIKTINGTSILGSGDITISGGSSSGGSGAYSEVNHGTSDTTFTLTPNTFHVWDEVSALTLALGSETSGVANEYLFQFTSGAAATSLTLPDGIKWAEELIIEPKRIYQVSILKGLASALSWENVSIISCNINLDYSTLTLNAEEGMTWEQWVYSKYNTISYQIIDGKIINQNQSHWITTDVGSTSLVSLSAVISAGHEYGILNTGGGGAGN